MAMTNEEKEELATLKERAKLMGIKFHHSTGLKKMREFVSDGIEGKKEEEPKTEVTKESSFTPEKDPSIQKLMSKKFECLSEKDFKQQKIKHRFNKARSLVRVNVTCMNPSKSEWEGEIFSAGSSKLGTYKNYVPFNATDGWHVPYIIYNMMRERRYSAFQTTTDAKGNKIRKAKLVPEFAIEILPPLTKHELKELARKQALAGNIDKD